MTRLKHIFINQSRKLTTKKFLSTRNKFVHSCSIKVSASGFDEPLESVFCIFLVVKAFFLQEVVEILEESVCARSSEYGGHSLCDV